MADNSELVKEVRAYWAAAKSYDEAVVAERESRKAAEYAIGIAEETELQLKQTMEKLADELGLVRIDGTFWVLRLTNGQLDVIQTPLLGVADQPADHAPEGGEKVENPLDNPGPAPHDRVMT